MVASFLFAVALQLAPDAPATLPSPPPPRLRQINDLSRPLDGTAPAGPYDEGVKDAFSRTQSRQGPLDGTWTLKDADGAGLYRIQLVDRGLGQGEIEGAWADLHAADASGFLAAASRAGDRLTLQFAEPGVGLAIATLEPRPDGGYSGELSTTAVGKPAERMRVSLVRP